MNDKTKPVKQPKAAAKKKATPVKVVDLFGGWRKKGKEELLHEAQQLVYDAWEAPTRKRCIELAKKALKISPDCADAYVILADDETSLEKAIELYQQAVAAGERALGRKAFKEYEGEFWGFLETRPYMRAMNGLASTLRALGQNDEAISIWREMLRLNPNDNQGVRYQLLACFMELHKDNDAEELIKKYKDDWSAEWHYSRALLAFRKSGDKATSRKKLTAAFEVNPYAPDYLLGRKKIPRRLPDYYTPGEVTEAVSFASAMLEGWENTPGALIWLYVVEAGVYSAKKVKHP